MVVLFVLCLGVLKKKTFVLLAPYVCFLSFRYVKVTEWPPIWENSCSFGLRYVSWLKYLIVSLFFSHLGFWSGNLFLIVPFPDLCLLLPF